MSTTTQDRPFAAATNKLAYAQAFTRESLPVRETSPRAPAAVAPRAAHRPLTRPRHSRP